MYLSLIVGAKQVIWPPPADSEEFSNEIVEEAPVYAQVIIDFVANRSVTAIEASVTSQQKFYF